MVRIPLVESELPNSYPVYYRFKQKPDEEQVACYLVPMKDLRPFHEDIRSNYERTLSFIKERFHNFEKSPYRKYNLEKLENAIFNLVESIYKEK
ncbi:hypothetical protein [Tepidibacillus fermentans]|uniref:Uncharacterized protein n=1 Tax=Tepidibacillus fermentans TaxID=1281767 RepID=A0A4R3KKS7_9BACI|nr:hypothetical protein [Tepidibacillus fermentans]TCS84495.1 hypothetical protein EDD72_101159 [Tepidibacillus fermentans]